MRTLFCLSRKVFTLMTFEGLAFSIWDLTTSIFEMMPTSFLLSSTTGRFLRPYLNRSLVASSMDMDGMAVMVPCLMISLISASGLSIWRSSSLAVTKPSRYPLSVIGNP